MSKSPSQKCARELAQELERMGVEATITSSHGRLRVEVECRGKSEYFTFSAVAKGSISLRNNICTVRRAFR